MKKRQQSNFSEINFLQNFLGTKKTRRGEGEVKFCFTLLNQTDKLKNLSSEMQCNNF